MKEEEEQRGNTDRRRRMTRKQLEEQEKKKGQGEEKPKSKIARGKKHRGLCDRFAGREGGEAYLPLF